MEAKAMDSLSILSSAYTSISRVTERAGLPLSKAGCHQVLDTESSFPAANEVFHSVPNDLALKHRSTSQTDAPVSSNVTVEADTYIIDKALANQQKIHSQLDNTSAGELIHGLPGKTILTEQFRTDKEGTYDLFAARLVAFEKDIHDTFSRFGRKAEALTLLSQLQGKLNRLKNEMSEDALLSLINGIQDYEKIFHKDSWIQMVSIAFIGISNLMKGAFAGQLKNLIAPERLNGGDRNLLDPAIVSKYNEGTVTSNPEGLAEVMDQVLICSGEDALGQHRFQLINQLQQQDYPENENILNPQTLIEHLAETQPALVSDLMAIEFKHEAYVKDADARRQGQNYLDQLQEAGNDTEKLIVLLQTAKGLGEYLGQSAQNHYLNKLSQGLDEKTQAALDQNTVLTSDELDELNTDLHCARQLEKALNCQTTAEHLNEMAGRIEIIACIPVHQTLCSGLYNGEKIWFLDNDLTLEQIAEAVRGTSPSKIKSAIQKLNAFIYQPSGDDLAGFREHLVIKDDLMSEQQDAALAAAQTKLGKAEEFKSALIAARDIEVARPPYQLISENITFLQRVLRAGHTAIRPERQPLEHRVRSLMLEHQLVLDGYNFNTEVQKLFSEMPELLTDIQEKTTHAAAECGGMVSGYMNGDESFIKLMANLGSLGNDTRNKIVKKFRDAFTGAAAIGQTSPRTLRALHGNIAQTAQNLLSTLGQNSPLYAMYNELNSRVSAETNAQYFIEALQRENVDLGLDKLTDEQRAAVRRLIAINTILSKAKYAPAAIEGVFKTVTGGLNPLNIAWNAAKTGVRLFTTYMIDNKVNAMRGEDLKILNTTLDILNDGFAVANLRQQAMEKSGKVMADIACQKIDAITVANATIFYPFRVLKDNLTDAFRDLRNRRPGSLLRMATMVLKAAPVVVMPVIASATLLTLPLISLGFLTFTVMGIPASLMLAYSWANWMVSRTGLVDIATLAIIRAREITNDPSIDFDQKAEALLRDANYLPRIQSTAKNHAYEGVAKKYKADVSPSELAQARAMVQESKADLDSQTQLNSLSQMAHTLRFLDANDIASLSMEELCQNIPADEITNIPAQEEAHHRSAWAMALQERLWDQLYFATGQSELPKDNDELKEWLDNFSLNRTLGMILVAKCPKAKAEYDEIVKLTADQIYLKMTQRMSTFMAKGMCNGLKAIFSNRIKASPKSVNGQMRPDDFVATLKNDKGLPEAIKQEFNDIYIAEMRKSGQYVHSRLKKALNSNGQHYSDDDVTDLTQAAAA